MNINKKQKFVSSLKTAQGEASFYDISKIKDIGGLDPSRLPFSIKVLLENALRNWDDKRVSWSDVENIAQWAQQDGQAREIAFFPGRVILQDFTGVPCVVDLAAMRGAMHRFGGDQSEINPQVPCDLIIDHSMQIDYFGSPQAFAQNLKIEFERNAERYAFLKWGQNVLKNFRVIPPSKGIIHQINLEHLAQGVISKSVDGKFFVFSDTCVGTDSHTTMINGIGVVGWGVGGIEAEAVMLGEPVFMLLPEVVGFRLKGQLKEGVTATDLVLTVTQMLREKGVVGKFVEFFGEGISSLSLPDRATVSNMAPEYGATIGVFPVDDETLRYYRLTGRDEDQVELVEKYFKAQGMFAAPGQPDPVYSDTLELDMGDVRASLAGPKRPQDRITLENMKASFDDLKVQPVEERGFGLTDDQLNNPVSLPGGATMDHGSVVIASITSCTNTSNPALLIGAGLLAQKAVERGMQVPSFVKTSLAPGSRVVEDYLKKTDLLPSLEQLGFHIVGFGCATCIGNSGPLPDVVAEAITDNDLVAASVLSGNRNFEGRISPLVKANFLASPPLVIAFALAGRMDIDLTQDPLGKDSKGQDVFLKDIWPSSQEIKQLVEKHINRDAFVQQYSGVSEGTAQWDKISAGTSELFEWNPESSYIQDPPFFADMTTSVPQVQPIKGARVLVKVGDSITTDHISPAGAISTTSPAGKYLAGLNVAPADFNSYGSRRGNDRVMARGTFANIRLRNQLAPGTEGSWTTHFPSQEKMSIYEASCQYHKDQIPLLVLAGKEYGTGSSRDWAAKGTVLLGVKAVLAQSYERIHRSNLAGMGVLPLMFKPGESAQSLGLNGDEEFDLEGINDDLAPGQEIAICARSTDGAETKFSVICRLDTQVEGEYFRNGGILQTVIRNFLKVE